MSGAGKMGDRGGSREGKKKSLNKIKQTKFKQEQNYFKDKQTTAERPAFSLPPPPITSLQSPFDDSTSSPPPPPSSSSPSPVPVLPPLRYFDSACHLGSRQFDTVLHSVVRRAVATQVLALIVTTPDFTKADEVLQLVRGYPGLMYCVLGVSPDVVKKHHDKVFDQRMDKLVDLSLCPEVVAISAGLDLTRDPSTHFLQQKLFASQVDLAIRIRLPLVVHEKAAADKVIDQITTSKAAVQTDDTAPPFRVAVHAFNGSDEQLAAFIDAGFFIQINGVVCDLKVGAKAADSSARPPAAAALPSSSSSSSSLLPELSGDGACLFRQLRGGLLPLSRLLLCSDSPLHTPANIDDVHLRSQRNEPSNLPFVYDVVAKALRIPVESLADEIDRNTRTFFQLSYAHEKQPQVGGAAEEKKEEKENPLQSAPPQPKKGQKGKVAFAAEVKGQEELPGKRALVDAVAKKLSQSRIDDGDAEDDEDEEEDEDDIGDEDEEPSSHDSTEGDEEEEESEEESEEDEDESLPSSTSSSPSSSHRAAAAASTALAMAAALQPAGRRRNAKVEDEEADDDWTTCKGGKKKKAAHPKQASAAKQGGVAQPSTSTAADAEDSDSGDGAAVVATKRGGGGGGGAPAGRKAASASTSRQRVIGSDVNLSLDREMVRYACKRCRTILFTEEDLVPHRSQQSSAAAASPAGKAEGGGRGKRSAVIDEWSRTQCERLFIRPMKWMGNLQFNTAGSSAASNATSAVLTTSDRIECGQCGYKLGRCGMVALYLPCSCGRQCDGPPPYFSVSLNRVDPIDHSTLLAHPREVSGHFEALQAEAEGEAQARQRERKALDRARKEKKTKRQQKEDQRGNFTSFRNKDLVHTKPKKDKDGGGTGAAATEAKDSE